MQQLDLDQMAKILCGEADDELLQALHDDPELEREFDDFVEGMRLDMSLLLD